MTAPPGNPPPSGNPPSENDAVPADDPDWVKSVVARALLHATNEEAGLGQGSAARVSGDWPSMQTTMPDFSPPEIPTALNDITHAPVAPPATVAQPPAGFTSHSEISPPMPPPQAPEPAVPAGSLKARIQDASPTEPQTPQPPLAPTPQLADTTFQSTSATAVEVQRAIVEREDIGLSDGLPDGVDRRSASVDVARPSRGTDDSLMEEADATTEGYRTSDLRTILEWLAVIVAALAVALLIKAFVLQAFWIPSVSMETTVNKGDRILVNKVSYNLHEVRRGDLVVFKKLPGAAGNTEDLIKRAIALPGETIEVRDDGRLWIWGPGETPEDAKRLEEPYLTPNNAFIPVPTSPNDQSAFGNTNCVNGDSPTRCTLDNNSYFMMGDNRTQSADSRAFGPVPEENIVGRAFLRIWPPSDIDTL